MNNFQPGIPAFSKRGYANAAGMLKSIIKVIINSIKLMRLLD